MKDFKGRAKRTAAIKKGSRDSAGSRKGDGSGEIQMNPHSAALFQHIAHTIASRIHHISHHLAANLGGIRLRAPNRDVIHAH